VRRRRRQPAGGHTPTAAEPRAPGAGYGLGHRQRCPRAHPAQHTRVHRLTGIGTLSMSLSVSVCLSLSVSVSKDASACGLEIRDRHLLCPAPKVGALKTQVWKS